MISHLRGTIIKKSERFAVVSVGGVGYKVFVPHNVLETLKDGAETSLWTHLAVREDALDLHGFLDEDTLGFFEMLITISGIGPRTALNVLNIVSPQTLRRAVGSGDTSYLTKVSGIGKKLADKIVLELKGKFEAEEETPGSHESMKGDADALEALKSLGYQEREAREALKKVPGDGLTPSEKVKQALKVLSNK